MQWTKKFDESDLYGGRMRVLIITDQRVALVDGKYYTEKVFLNNVKRYRRFFDSVSVYAKTGEKIYSSSEMITNVEVYLGGDNKDIYIGKNKKKLEKIIPSYDLVILRVPSILAFQAADICRTKNIPYFAVVVGCVWDSFWNHGIEGKLLAPYMKKKMKKIVEKANYVSYVSEQFLQRRYPCSCKSLAASDVTLAYISEDILLNRMRMIDNRSKNTIRLFTAAGLNVRYKGQQYVIRAIKYLNALGYNVEYTLVGTGDSSYLESVAANSGISNQVNILGAVTHDCVIELMDKCDIYVQPSLQEGLPRSVVEAMSRACPCIGTGAGGISELIDKKYQFIKKSPKSIANKIVEIWNAKTLSEMATENFQTSKKYTGDILENKRTKYYEYLINDLEKKEKK